MYHFPQIFKINIRSLVALVAAGRKIAYQVKLFTNAYLKFAVNEMKRYGRSTSLSKGKNYFNTN